MNRGIVRIPDSKLNIYLRSLTACLLFFVSMEFCARIDDKIKYQAPVFGAYRSERLRETDQNGIRHNIPNSRFEKWQINQFGFRGEPFPIEKSTGVKRIVCMGTSETFGLYEDPGKEWPAQLAEILAPCKRFQVINASVVGLTLDKFIPYMERYVFKFKPDVVILYVNPYFYNPRMSRATISEANGTENRAAEIALNAGLVKKLMPSPRFLPKVKETIKNFLPRWMVKRYQIWNMATQVNSIERRALKEKEPQDSIPGEVLMSYRNDLCRLVMFLNDRHIEVVLSSYPTLISQDNIDKHLDIFLDNRRFSVYLSFIGMMVAPKQFNDVTRSVAEDLRVGFVDNSNQIAKDVRFFGDNVHYTSEGARLVASNFAELFLGGKSRDSAS
jgi:hypothetical protein